MDDSEDSPVPADPLPEALVQQLDSLALPELKAARSYVEQRIETFPTQIEAEIEAEIQATAAGEVIEVEDQGGYALVRKHPPNPDGPGANTDMVSLYEVYREPHPDGTESLRWRFIGDVDQVEESRCQSCGSPLDDDATVCPHCGSETVHQSETEE